MEQSKVLDPKSNLKALGRIIVLVAVLLGAIWLFVRFSAGEKAANKTTAAILHRPIELQNSIQTIKASSIVWMGLNVAYTGTVSIEAYVKKGNDIDIYVVPADQIEKVKAQQQFNSVTSFNASKTKNYKRAERIPSGSYYLVLMDKSLGILSQATSDVQVVAKLEP